MGLVGKSGHLVEGDEGDENGGDNDDQDEQDEKKGESLLKVKRILQSLP